jgi:hypothetical protein
MNARSLLLTAVLVLGPVACSKPPSPPSQPSADESGAAPAPKTTEVAPPAGAANEPGTAAPTPGDATVSTTYIVKDNGKRCFAPPCDHYDLFRADKPDEKVQSIHELDLSAITGGDSAKQEELMKRAFAPGGLKLEGSVDTKAKAIRNTDVIVLKATRAIDG